MGQTPLALIVLENRGNYTKPIHQRTAWACSTLSLINTHIHFIRRLSQTQNMCTSRFIDLLPPASRLARRLRWACWNEASSRGRTATTHSGDCNVNVKPITAQNLTKEARAHRDFAYNSAWPGGAPVSVPVRDQMITLCLRIPWLHHCISLHLLIIFEQMSQDTHSVSYGNFIPESVVR